jgi:hypothetical protein
VRPGVIIACGIVLVGLVGCNRPAQNAETPNVAGKIATTYEEALASARAQNKPILLVAYQGRSDDVDQMVLSEPRITEQSSKFVTAKLDGGQQSAAMARLGITQYPTLMILNARGTPVWSRRGASPIEVANAMDQALRSGGGQPVSGGPPGGMPEGGGPPAGMPGSPRPR